MSQLQDYIKAFGPTIEVGHRAFTVEGITEDEDSKVATFNGPRAKYTAIASVHSNLVAGKPGAEVWSIIGRSVIGRFAIHEGKIYPLV